MKIPVNVVRTLALAFAAGCGLSIAGEPDRTLDEITMSATKFATSLLEVPATVIVITRL